MTKIIGAVLIILSCSGIGASIVAAHRKQEHALGQFLRGLEYMICELQYRMTPLPELCLNTGALCSGCVGAVFTDLSAELTAQIAPDAATCMHAALSGYSSIPGKLQTCFLELGASLGRFDLQGQIMGLEAVKRQTELELYHMQDRKDVRLRSYQTLGVCAGAALVVLFL